MILVYSENWNVQKHRFIQVNIVFLFFYTEIDTDGVIEEDKDEPQEMGDASLEVSEEMMDQSNDKRSQAMAASSEG